MGMCTQILTEGQTRDIVLLFNGLVHALKSPVSLCIYIQVGHIQVFSLISIIGLISLPTNNQITWKMKVQSQDLVITTSMIHVTQAIDLMLGVIFISDKEICEESNLL